MSAICSFQESCFRPCKRRRAKGKVPVEFMVLVPVKKLWRFSRLHLASDRVRPIRRGFAVQRGRFDSRECAAAGRACVQGPRSAAWPGGADASPRPPVVGSQPVHARVGGGVHAATRRKVATGPTGRRVDPQPFVRGGLCLQRRFPLPQTELERRRFPRRCKPLHTVVGPPAPPVREASARPAAEIERLSYQFNGRRGLRFGQRFHRPG